MQEAQKENQARRALATALSSREEPKVHHLSHEVQTDAKSLLTYAPVHQLAFCYFSGVDHLLQRKWEKNEARRFPDHRKDGTNEFGSIKEINKRRSWQRSSSPLLLKTNILVEHSAFTKLDKAQAKCKPKAAMPTEALQLLNDEKQPKKETFPQHLKQKPRQRDGLTSLVSQEGVSR